MIFLKLSLSLILRHYVLIIMKNKISTTELAPKNHQFIDKLSIEDATTLMLYHQSEAIKAVNNALPEIRIVIKLIYDVISKSNIGRLIYAGAGTSARIGVQDGVELYPTFGWPLNRVHFLIAGGEKALLSSIENAEDEINRTKELIHNLKLSKHDIVIGLAASGNTPFTKTILIESLKYKSLTIPICNNPYGEILNFSKNSILLDTGPEVLVGSTRLKAGTAQKICLNIISTMVMSMLGRIKDGQMSNMVPTNKKLRERMKRMKLNGI